ncbi:phosphoglycerate mutase-like protein [Thelephora terrestris]|uniref:Phosphoglycerate mutase-like protein n=1 Tax=Thelephora terrestris TaxID=56493 RepID=A0A9P6HJT0_9AGAM|nr:phosphoglycerate mutase-like protein [Thelephora terrestris]
MTPGSDRDSNNRPGHTPLDVENYPVAPATLQLEQVHVFVRHGERTPVSIRMSEAPANIPPTWLLCKEGRKFGAAVSSHTGSNILGVERVVENEDGSLEPGECLLGELTDLGRKSTYNLGAALRGVYIDKLKLLPDVAHNDSEVYFRSTNLPRTIESLQQIIHGLYPPLKQAEGFVSKIRTRNPKDENLYGNSAVCERLKTLMLKFAQAAAVAWNPTLEPLDEKISKYIGGNPVRLDGKPRASGILDTVRAARAHGIRIPEELRDNTVMDVLEKAVIEEWFSAYRTEEVRKLAMGRLLAEMSGKMNQTATGTGPTAPKILIHSTHDTAIAGLLGTLEVFDNRWPEFTAVVTFELFREAPDSRPAGSFLTRLLSSFTTSGVREKHYIRARYQNTTLFLPLCQNVGDHLDGHPELCTLEAFNRRVKELTPKWEVECALHQR